MSGAGDDRPVDGAERRLRCFVAAFVQPESAGRLREAVLSHLDDDVAEGLVAGRAAREVPPVNYHVTLKFLGEIEPPAIREALAAVADLDGCEVAAQAAVLAGFPRLRAARLAAAVLRPHEQLEGWWSALQERLGAEGRSFRPHVTVLRFRRPRTFVPCQLADTVPLTLQAPALYRSDPGPEGVAYRPIRPPALPPHHLPP